MFAIRKCSLLNVSYQSLIKNECADIICNISGLFQPKVLSNLTRTKFNSSNQKEDCFEVVKLSAQTYEPTPTDAHPPIIIMHGLLGSKSNWNTMAKALVRDLNNRKVIAIDARNHGNSPHTEAFSYEVMLCDLMKFMHDGKITKASFIGHSMGGRVAMLLALMYPMMVHSLVVVDISPNKQSPNMLGLSILLNQIKNLQVHAIYPASLARRHATHLLKQENVDENLIRFLMTNLVDSNDNPNSNWRWKFNIESISKNFEKEICNFPDVSRRSFDERTLFIAGENSDYIKKEDEDGIKAHFPSAEFAYVSGAGHWVHAEKPQEFLKLVTQFFKKD